MLCFKLFRGPSTKQSCSCQIDSKPETQERSSLEMKDENIIIDREPQLQNYTVNNSLKKGNTLVVEPKIPCNVLISYSTVAVYSKPLDFQE